MLLNITCVHCRLHRVLDVASRRAIGSFESSFRYLQVNFSICRCCQGVPFNLNLFNLPGRYLLSTFGLAFARTTWLIWITSVSCGQRVLCRKLFLKSQSYMDGAARYAPYTAPLYWIPWPNPCTLSDRKVSDIFNDNAGLQYASPSNLDRILASQSAQ